MKIIRVLSLTITIILSCWTHDAAASESSLRWGTAFDTASPSVNVKRYQNRILDVVQPSLGKEIPAEEQILAEGKLPTDPGVAESNKITGRVPMIP